MNKNNPKKETDCKPRDFELVQKVKNNLPETEILSNASDFFKIMGDLTRIKILSALDISPMCVCDLSVVLNMTKSAVSHQLKALKNASLVKSQKNGKHVLYSLDDDHIKTVLEMALEHINE